MSTDPLETGKQAYIAYVCEKEHPPSNATQLMKWSKCNDFKGVYWSIANKVMKNPPSINVPSINVPSTNTQSQSVHSHNNTSSGTQQQSATISDDVTARSRPKSNVQQLQQKLLAQNLNINNIHKNPQTLNEPKPFQSGDSNAQKVKTVFQALADLKDIEDEKYELKQQTNTAQIITCDEKTNENIDHLQELNKIESKMHVKCTQSIIQKHSYSGDDHGHHVKITPITTDPILNIVIDQKFDTFDVSVEFCS